MDDTTKLKALRLSLRVWAIMSLFIFGPLFLGFVTRTPLLKEQTGVLNWSIWNDVVCSGPTQSCHVPPMLFLIYLVWAVYLLVAAKDPTRYRSFLIFTMWANFAHGALMAFQALTELDRYWSKFLTDVPWVSLVALAILLFLPKGDGDAGQMAAARASGE